MVDGEMPCLARWFVTNIADEGVAEIVETAFAAVKAQQPKGVQYAYGRRTGTTEFIALLELAETWRTRCSASRHPDSSKRPWPNGS
jgi:hypothetical protein